MVRIFMPDGGSSGDVAWREVAGDGFELFWSMFGRRACQHGWRVGGDVVLELFLLGCMVDVGFVWSSGIRCFSVVS